MVPSPSWRSSHTFSLMGEITGCQLLLAVGSGILLTLAFPPINGSFVAWFALVPLFFALNQAPSSRSALMLGWVTGFVHSATVFHWTTVAMHYYGKMPLAFSILVLVLFALYLGAYTGIFGWLFGSIQTHAGRFALFLSAPAGWVLMEYLRGTLLTGFPWALLGHSQSQNLSVIQICDITGVPGLSFLVVMVNMAVFFLSLRLVRQGTGNTGSARFPIWESALTVGVLALVFGYGMVRLDDIQSRMEHSPQLKVGLLQGNIDQSQKWDPANFRNTLLIYKTLTKMAAEKGAELVVWPETAVPGYYVPDLVNTPVVQAMADENNVPIIFGSLSYERENSGFKMFNSAFAVIPHETVLYRYDKSHLVPFGEYIPLKPLLPFVDKLVEGIGEFSSGQRYPIFPVAGARCGVLICYEVIFARGAAAYAREGANLLVNITNDAWFGRTGATYQHLSTAVFRAVETRLPVVRAANTGVSAIVDQTGKIRAQTPVFTKTFRTGTIPIFEERTFFVCYRQNFVLVCVVIVLAVIFRAYLFSARGR